MNDPYNHQGNTVLVTEEKYLTPREVSNIFRVDSKTVSRWADTGKLSSIRTPGGHRRFLEAEVRALLNRPQS